MRGGQGLGTGVGEEGYLIAALAPRHSAARARSARINPLVITPSTRARGLGRGQEGGGSQRLDAWRPLGRRRRRRGHTLYAYARETSDATERV